MKIAKVMHAKEVRLAIVVVKLVGVPLAVVWILVRLVGSNELSSFHIDAGPVLAFVLLTEISFWTTL